MKSDVNWIEISMDGRRDMFRTIFAPTKNSDKPSSLTKERMRELGKRQGL